MSDIAKRVLSSDFQFDHLSIKIKDLYFTAFHHTRFTAKFWAKCLYCYYFPFKLPCVLSKWFAWLNIVT